MSSQSAEEIRRTFSAAWGEIGAAWGVTPSTAAVQGYFLVHGGPLTEPQIRGAPWGSPIGRPAWGLVERGATLRRDGQRGPAATAYTVLGDHWEWFRRVARARKERESDPAIPLIERCVTLAHQAAGREPDPELADLAERLDGLLGFVRLFDRGVGSWSRPSLPIPRASSSRATATGAYWLGFARPGGVSPLSPPLRRRRSSLASYVLRMRCASSAKASSPSTSRSFG
ncbi:MAG: hypothetical protein H0W81_12375 [Chloroflexi bacterium]|nr:hypothetical protein [Chloroflexota bacterium]